MAMLNRCIPPSFRTRSNLLAVFLTIVLCASLPCAAQSPVKPAATPTKEDVLKALGQQTLAHDPALQVEIKPWHARPGSFVALLYLTASNDEMDVGDGTEIVRAPRLQPTLALLQYVDGHLVATAKSDAPDALGKDCHELPKVEKDSGDTPADQDTSTDGTYCQAFTFDLAPYRLTPAETAIGIRTQSHEIYPAGEGDDEDLTLFSITGHQLKPVFSATMSSSSEERGPNEMLTSKSTLQISQQKTGDHFDLLLVDHDDTEKLVSDASGGHPGKHLVKRTFTWNGSAYVEAK
jgi:hypothetical protein